ncbi:MAG TPA: YtxH domain-containing protein [Flavipsychrobacter sp.]|nr:YtxH domain-containing protein [Flavipsychrobacter sp.]
MSKFLTGLLVGVAAGMLLAPDSGENTRKQLSDDAGKLKGKLDKLLGRAEAELDDLKAYLDKNITGLSAEAKRKILAVLDDVEEMTYHA